MIPSHRCFEWIQTLNFDRIVDLPAQEIRLILPCLVRMFHCETASLIADSNSKRWTDNRFKIQRLLQPFNETNDIRRLSALDYNQLESDVKRELQLRMKNSTTNASCQQSSSSLINGSNSESYLLSNVKPEDFVRVFEREDSLLMKMRLTLYELITLMMQIKNSLNAVWLSSGLPAMASFPSELLDTDIYIDEFVDLIFFAISEMPNTFQLSEIVEALLLIKNGPEIVCRLVANFPDSFHEVCNILINNQTSGNDEQNFLFVNRVAALRKLCQMNPTESLSVRSEAVELCRMPNLVVLLTLDHHRFKLNQKKRRNKNYDDDEDLEEDDDDEEDDDEEDDDDDDEDLDKSSHKDLISFITGILLSNNEKVRSWFAHYIKRKNQDLSQQNSFLEFRLELLKRFREVTQMMVDFQSSSSALSNKTTSANQEKYEASITEACIMLRLYCALRGLATMKFLDDETQAISRMIVVCRPPHIDIGVRFVSVGLCMILAFPQLITISQENESKIIDWIKWLVKEENYFGRKTNSIQASFGEMLLLIAIYFHSNQMSQIGELVSSTIGIKLPLRTNDLNLIKHIFTQEIFTEQTVTAHAIKVPVTRNLNNNITGTLPIHCIYQLLKSRAFTKNRVPIRVWIFKQLCHCIGPVHDVLPLLIEAYVNSILIPNTQSGHMTNEPISENDLNSVFNRIVYSFEIPDLDLNCDQDDDDQDDDDDDEDDDHGSDLSDEDNHNDDENNGFDEKMDIGDDDQIGGESSSRNRNNASEEIDPEKQRGSQPVRCLLTSQLLFLYYVLLYEDVRLNNIRQNDRPIMRYSSEFLSRLPIFYLVQKTQTCADRYGKLRPSLLRLISFHYPHLCLVRDWLPRIDRSLSDRVLIINHQSKQSSSGQIKRMVANQRRKIVKLFRSLAEKRDCRNREAYGYYEQLIALPDELLWPMAADFIQTLPWIVETFDSTPRSIQILMKKIWFRLNHIFPTRLWVMTVNVLQETTSFLPHRLSAFTWDDIVIEPTAVLRCDQRVFRSPELMDIILHMLNGFLSASRIKCVHHLMECTANMPRNEDEKKKREEMSRNYTLVLESAAIQMLLECCSTRIDEEIETRYGNKNHEPKNVLSNIREIQGLVCHHLHQSFIADPNLAKMVHIQGYNPELLPIAVQCIPSMHICLDFIPEILQTTYLTKQSFAINLTSHLCVQYPIVRSFSVGKLCLEVCQTLLSLLPNDKRSSFYLSVLPALERICQVFPPMIESFVRLLISLAQKNISTLASQQSSKLLSVSDHCWLLPMIIDHGTNGDCSPDSSTNEIMFNNVDVGSLAKHLNKSQLIEMSWSDFEQRFTADQIKPGEMLALAIHKSFGMVCQLGSLNRIYKDESL